MEPITEEVKIMLLLGFFSGFLFLTLLLHKRSEKLRSAVLIGYNFLFAAIVLTLRQLGGEAFSFEAVLNAFLRAIYATPMLITFNGDLSDTADVQDLIMILFISVYTFRTAVRLIFRKTVLAVKTGARVLFRSSVNILWGDGADAAAMLEEIRKNEKRAAVVWIPFDRDDAQEPDAFAATPDYFRKLRRRKRYTVVLLPDPQDGNPARLRQLEQTVPDGTDIRVTAFIRDDTLRLDQFCFPKLDLCLMSREALAADILIRKERPVCLALNRGYAVTDGVRVPNGPFRLCIVGFSAFSRAILLQSCENAAFETAEGKGFAATVFCRSGDGHELFAFDYPALRDRIEWVCTDAGTEAAALMSLAETDAPVFDEIILSEEKTARNMENAQRLLRTLRRSGKDPLPVIAAAVSDGDTGCGSEKAQAAVHLIRIDRTQFSFDAVVGRSIDRDALRLHRQYCKNNPGAKPWSALDSFTQSSNRAAAADRENKRALCPTLPASPAEREASLWRLAKYEHLRWQTFHETHGWTRLPADALTDAEKAAFITKRPEEKRHACLTDWDLLDDLPQSEPGLLKRYDYLNVAAFYEETEET
ncbi:MAG: hypothetical protein IJK40_06610 [Clostridia bacterium]|nr:hypothetical protein [Clostridia bacterium]